VLHGREVYLLAIGGEAVMGLVIAQGTHSGYIGNMRTYG
jgi:hypothetical protein